MTILRPESRIMTVSVAERLSPVELYISAYSSIQRPERQSEINDDTTSFETTADGRSRISAKRAKTPKSIAIPNSPESAVEHSLGVRAAGRSLLPCCGTWPEHGCRCVAGHH